MNNVTQPPGAIRAAFCRGVSGKGARTRRLKSCDFYSFDGDGNVAALASAANGNVTAQYGYGPFGEVIRATGPMAKLNPFRFSTKYQDDESDLNYYGYRYYKASTGTWVNRDPLGEKAFFTLYTVGKSRQDEKQLKAEALKPLYALLHNDPENLIDINGLDPKPSSCWQSVSDFYCGSITNDVQKLSCKLGLKCLFKTPGAKAAACLVQQTKCTTCCGTTYDDIDDVNRCVHSCHLEYAKCIIQSF